MRLKDYIKEIIRPNRDVQQQRGGEVAKAIFTPSAPQELQDRGSEENVWLLNSQPLRVRIGDDNEEIEDSGDFDRPITIIDEEKPEAIALQEFIDGKLDWRESDVDSTSKED